MADEAMLAQATGKGGFIAALDESGGSTPGSLKRYGIPPSDYSGDAEMFELMHRMRSRVITAPAFNGDKIIGAILFEKTMVGEVEGMQVPRYLWEKRGVVPYLKVDKGTEDEAEGVKLLKPIPDLESQVRHARELGVFGTKMRSVIGHANEAGIRAIVAQQFEVGAKITAGGLMPILEPEVLITAPDKEAAETILLREIIAKLDELGHGTRVMLKLTIPTRPDLYRPLVEHRGVARVVALSGGYEQAEACERLSHNHGMIASFSRALLEGLTRDMSEESFDARLGQSIDRIYAASTTKH